MGLFVVACKRVSIWMNIVSGIVVFFIMFLTVADVLLRLFRKPINGTYELVAVAGAIVIGYAMPKTSWDGAHIAFDLPLVKSEKLRHLFFVVTRFLGIGLFAIIGWNLLIKGQKLYATSEVSQTLHIPGYPFAYVMALCCWMECLVLLTDILKPLLPEADHE
jgi:TRAP-type C4-dicarboxylate transport system permease small subunit